tara:strand:+ start:131 stop:514 length:384 start_codon:yes stop_codon:yes gene_type:complete
MKSIITAGLLLGVAHSLTAPAIAGVYGNIETNAGVTGGGEYQNATTEIHLGVEGEVGSASVYAQAGPALVAVEGVDGTELEYSGKAGIGVDVGERINVYGEVAFQTVEREFNSDIPLGLKAGLKYDF